MRNLTAVLAVAFCLTFPAESANAQDYNSEIDQYVFMPCLRTGMSARGETEHLNLPDDAILEAVRQTIMGSVLNDLHTEISKAVSGRPFVERIELNKNFSSFCALTMMQEQR